MPGQSSTLKAGDATTHRGQPPTLAHARQSQFARGLVDGSRALTGPTTFTGTDNTGDPFAILYTGSGIRWLRGKQAEPYAARRTSVDPASPAFKLSAATNYIGAAAQLAEAAAAVGN